jgi:hypothetical protein
MTTAPGATLLPDSLRAAIEAAIDESATAWERWLDDNRSDPLAPDSRPLAVKYVPSRYAASYLIPGAKLVIGSSNFTWGRGVYVTGVEEPLSTAIYGRAGIVSTFDPKGWKVFDARSAANEALYLDWLQHQADYREAVLTVHADYWLHRFRNFFREQFAIDAVLFHPDEFDSLGWYTRSDDTWLAVSDWTSDGYLSEGDSYVFIDPRLTILIEEDFKVDNPALTRLPLLRISGGGPSASVRAGLPSLVRDAYRRSDLERVAS